MSYWTGKKHKKSSILKMRMAKLGKPGVWRGKKRPEGEKATNWKGDKVGYPGVHDWVRKMLGWPTTCSHCGKTGLIGHKAHWANISGKYKRDIKDWIRLCVKCHFKMDDTINRGWKTRKKNGK